MGSLIFTLQYYDTEKLLVSQISLRPLSEGGLRALCNPWHGGKESCLCLAHVSSYSSRECSFNIEQYVNNILLVCVFVCVCVSLPKECQAYCYFLPSAVWPYHTTRGKVLQRERETTGKVSTTWKGVSSRTLQERNRRAVIHICHPAQVCKEEEHAVHFMQRGWNPHRRNRAGMQSHQGGLTFYCEDAGARCCASAVHGLAHVLALVLREGLGQVEAVRLSSLYILIVLTVLERLSLEPPGDLRLWLPSDLNSEPHRLLVHHRLILEGLFEPRRPRPGVILLIFIGCRAVDDAALILPIILLFLQTHVNKNQEC